jgi:hypothetical protein
MTTRRAILLPVLAVSALAALTATWLACFPFRTPQGAALSAFSSRHRALGDPLDTLRTGPIYVNVPSNQPSFRARFGHDLPTLTVPFRVLSDGRYFARGLIAADSLKAIGGVLDIREFDDPSRLPFKERTLHIGEALFAVRQETCRGWPCHSWVYIAVLGLAGRYRATGIIGQGVE